MQYKSLIHWIFYNIGKFYCPKSAFSLIYIDIKVLVIEKNYAGKNAQIRECW